MSSKMCRLLLVALLALAFVDIGTACRSAKPDIAKGGVAKTMWYCPPEEVLFVHDEVSRCFEKCAKCPNGFCHQGRCNCFPGTRKDKAGVCGKICKDCEDGWCSSVSKCECNEDFTMMKDRCVNLSESCQADYMWDPASRSCVPYESINDFNINARMSD